MKRIFLFLFILLSFKSFSQVSVVGYITTQGVALYPTHYDSMGFGGYRIARDTTERNAITCLRRKFGMAVYVQNINKIYILKDSACNNIWEEFTTSSISKAVDSVYKKINDDSIYIRYNNGNTLKIKDSIGLAIDTSTMLSKYLRKYDTTLMLSPYLRKIDTTNKFVNSITKNSTKDSIVFFIGGNRYAIKDSSSSNIGTGTVTSISQGYGILNSPNPITTTGTITIDSATLSNKYLRLNDTSNMLKNYIDIYDTSNMLSGYARKSRTIATTSPLTGGGSLNGDLTLSIPASSNITSGYLSSVDWLSFYNKANNTISINAKLGTSGSNLDGGGNLTTSRVITIPKATTSVDGYLSATDYITFAGKQGALSPTSPIEISGSLLSIRKASAIDSGYLSSSNWNTFNNKLNPSDTTNKFVNNVIKLNDSTISVYKGTGFTNITLTPSTTVASATRLITTVYNNSGSTITKGSVVYINGRHSSNLPTVALAQANTEVNSYSTFAMVQDDILNNNTGTVIQAGNISNLNLPTSTYTDGQLVYLSPTVAGGITTTKPLAPNHIVKIGTITRAHPTLGSIELKIENGWQLDELSDVKIALVPADSTILQFSRVDSLWHDVNPTTAMGNRFVKISDSSAMLSKYLRKTDTTNKFVNTITRIPGKDSIIFYVGSTRYAIKDSLASASGAAGPEYAVQYKNADGYMAGDANLTWIYQSKKLGIGTDDPQTTLDVRQGTLDYFPRVYEVANFSKNGDTKLGVYNSGDYGTGGTSIMLGNVKNPNASGYWPGFEFQNVNDSSTSTGYVRYNYVEKDNTGAVALAAADLFNINSNGTVQINPSNYGVSATPRLVVGEDNQGATLETSGTAFVADKFQTGGARLKKVTYLNDDVDGTTYSVNSTDHIIIYVTNNNNCTVNLPSSPENGRELIIKHSGDASSYTLTIDGGSHEIYDMGSTTGVILSDTLPNTITIIYYDGTWFTLQGQWQ